MDDLPVDLDAAVDGAYRRLHTALDQARAVLLGAQPGPLPARCDCRQEDRWVLDEVEAAERQVDRLRRLSQVLTATTASRRASAGAVSVLNGATRREREAARLVGLRTG